MGTSQAGSGRDACPSLGAGLRVAPGLDLGERVLLRSSGARARLPERTRSGDGPLPADRDLALAVDVQVFPLPEVLSWIHGAGRSGLLLFAHGDHAKWVWLHRGEIVFAASNQRIDRLGPSLVRAGVISLEQLRDAERGFRRSERFGKALVERGLITPRELWTGLQRQVEEIVRSLFSYPSALVYYWDGEVQPDNVVRLHLPTRRLVAEGIRWRDELRRFLAALSDPRVRIEAVAGKREITSGPDRLLVEALAEESAFGPLCRRLGLHEPTAARTLHLLHRAGAVRIRRRQEDPDMTLRVRRQGPEHQLRCLIQQGVQLIAELAAPIVAAEGEAAFGERFAGTLEEVATRYPGLLAGVQPVSGATLDAEVLIRRALALPPERVRDAVDALLDYLEFELKNHPGVSGADRVLRSVAPLRATLTG